MRCDLIDVKRDGIDGLYNAALLSCSVSIKGMTDNENIVSCTTLWSCKAVQLTEADGDPASGKLRGK